MQCQRGDRAAFDGLVRLWERRTTERLLRIESRLADLADRLPPK